MNTREKKRAAFSKALAIINSCKTSEHVRCAYNYIDNFKKVFGEEETAKKLKHICSTKRTLISRGL